MQGYFAVCSFVLMILCVILRARQLKKLGIQAFLFGKLDKKDFLIPPFALFYIYQLLANTFHLPNFGIPSWSNAITPWIGTVLCILAPCLFFWGILSFGKSFRVGIDLNKPGSLVTTGAFAFSRNPLYLAFFLLLGGIFLIFPTWVTLLYFFAGLWLINRQVRLEEEALKKLYGAEYETYCKNVRRYL